MQNAGSLVKYHTPILVNTVGSKNVKKGTKKGINSSDKQTTQTEDILNSILPPRYIYISIHMYIQIYRLIDIPITTLLYVV